MFSDRLKEVRKKKLLTQVQLAEALHIASGTVAMWEVGKREPNFEMVTRIANFFDVSLDYLLGRTDDPKGYIIKAPAELADAGVVSVEKSGGDQLTPEEVAAIRAMLEREVKGQ